MDDSSESCEPEPGSGIANAHSDSDSNSSDPNSGDQDQAHETQERVGLGPYRGKHGVKHRQAILQVLPYLRTVLEHEGSAMRADRVNVKEAVSTAEAAGVCFWGRGQLYSSRNGVISCILNMYYADTLRSLGEQ